MNKTFRRFMIYLLVVSAAVAVSCGKKADFYGTWRGKVMGIVDVEYSFGRSSYESKTYSINNVMVGGTRGDILSVTSDRVELQEKEAYEFDNKTNKGKWTTSSDKYSMEYSISGNKLTLKPSTADMSYTLDKKD